MEMFKRANEGEQFGPRDVWVCDCRTVWKFTKEQTSSWGRGFIAPCTECGTSRWFMSGRVVSIQRPQEAGEA